MASTEQTASQPFAWRLRRCGTAPSAVRNGIEVRLEGSVTDLVNRAKAVTLFTPDGDDVQVRVVGHSRAGRWAGVVVRTSGGHDTPRIGAMVSFEDVHVFHATV